MPLEVGRLYNAADLSDIEEAIEHIYRTYCFDENNVQIRRLTGVGVSLGCSMLANYAAKKGASS